MGHGPFQAGDTSGIGHAIGHGAKSNVRIGTEQSKELSALVKELRQAIADAGLPQRTQQVMLERTIPALEQAPTKPDPKEAVQSGLERVSEQLEGVGDMGDKVVRIAEVARKLAGVVGVTLATAAPFLGKLLGR
ncbi:MAG: hypothetical protein AB7G11_04460 [Phycisphaerales bacterium]